MCRVTTRTAIRLADCGDLPVIMDIYNYEVINATSTFDTEPVTLENRRTWLASHDPERHPVLVAELAEPGRTSRIAGFGSLSPWSPRRAYAGTAEVSVYVHRDGRGRGIGKAILAALIARAESGGLRVLLARICAEGQASLGLHEALGFQHIGTMHRVGEKLGRILDIELYELQLDGAKRPDGSRHTQDTVRDHR